MHTCIVMLICYFTIVPINIFWFIYLGQLALIINDLIKLMEALKFMLCNTSCTYIPIKLGFFYLSIISATCICTSCTVQFMGCIMGYIIILVMPHSDTGMIIIHFLPRLPFSYWYVLFFTTDPPRLTNGLPGVTQAIDYGSLLTLSCSSDALAITWYWFRNGTR